MKRNDLKQNLLYKLQEKKYCQRKYKLLLVSQTRTKDWAPQILLLCMLMTDFIITTLNFLKRKVTTAHQHTPD